MPRQRKKLPEINASSMADIAFLLLIFFLVTTTMDIDKGLMVLLPPYSEEPPPDSDVNKRNVLEILVNANDMLLVENQPLAVDELREITKKHVNNRGADPNFSDSPTKAVVSLSNDKGTSYDIYFNVQNELKAAYNELRDAFAQQKFGRDYENLDKDQQRVVKDEYPLRISEAEPKDFAGK
jgi:biopolymer transport protein ExbD